MGSGQRDAVGASAGDSQTPNRPTLYLGKKEIQTSLPGFFSYRTTPVAETLRFAIPATASLCRFDEITMMLLPDGEPAMVGPKIAIEQLRARWEHACGSVRSL